MSCVGCNDGCFDESVQLAQGPTGNAGTNGSNGLYGGWSLKWKFDDNTGSGTGSNEVRLNSVDPQAANVIYVNDDAYGTGAADVFLSSVTSAPFGKIKIFKEYDSTVFWLATITAADDTAVPAEVKFTVTDVVTNGSFTDGDDVVLTLAPAGATGATGPATPGPDGAALLKSIANESSDYTAASYGPPVIATGDGFPWVVTADTLSTDLDTLRLEGLVLGTKDDETKTLRIQANVVDLNVGFLSFPLEMAGNIVGFKFSIDLVRVSGTSLKVESTVDNILDTLVFGTSLYNYSNSEIPLSDGNRTYKNGQTVAVSALDSNDFSIGIDLKTTDVASPLKLVNCKLIKFKKS